MHSLSSSVTLLWLSLKLIESTAAAAAAGGVED
jgi:hypothetical protein